MGYGQGSAGTPGTGFQLLIIIFMLLFGVTLGQLVAALSPSIQVPTTSPLIDLSVQLTLSVQGCCAVQSFYRLGLGYILWRNDPIPNHDKILEVLDLPTRSIYKNACRDGFYRAPVRPTPDS
jgi:hypothetical protein